MADSVPAAQPDEKPSDWKIKELYKKAWPIVKKNKVLWIFGIAVGTGTSFRSNSSIDQKDIDAWQKLFQNNQHSDQGQALGAATSIVSDALAAIFSAIPVYFYIIAGLEVLFLIGVGFAISIIYQSWAEAGLLHGIQTAIANGKVTIRETSEKAFRNIKGIALVRIVPILIFIIAAFIGFFIVSVISYLGLGPMSGLLIFAYLLFCIFAFIMLYFSQLWAVRKVVIENLQAKQALQEGYHISTKKFWAMFGLSIVNTLLYMGIMLGIVLVLLGPAIGILFSLFGTFTKNPQLGIPLVIVASCFIVAFMVASEAARGILSAFVNTVWSLAYQNIKGKYDK